MDKNAIKKYAVWARRELISRVSQRAALYEITADGYGDQNAAKVHDRIMSTEEKKQRIALIDQIKEKGYEQVMEEIAYTWFNRFSALRFMEVNGYLPTRIRVFTDDENNFKPQILNEAINMELDGLDMQKVYDLKNANDDDALFKYLIITQCNALSSILPGMFQRISDYTELLFPDNLLREGSVVEQMIVLIPQEDWTDQVQIIGWLYQYYNTEPKDKVFANLKKNIKISKENIPAATQLFTPDWIVRYMVENSLGRLWLEGHPNDDLKAEWKYYLDEAEQEPEAQEQLVEIRKKYAALKPEEILAIDPCQGSGHILAYMFDVLVQIYESYGYSAREAAASIVEHNIWGLDIDERAAQLAYFSVMMKARQYDRRFFSRGIQPHVYAIQESNNIDLHCIEYFVNGRKELKSAVDTLVKELHDAKEYGSILNVTQVDFDTLLARVEEIENESNMGLYSSEVIEIILPFLQVARIMAQKYHVVVTNPPYMGASGMNAKLNKFIKENYSDFKSDFFSVFVIHATEMVNNYGYCGFFTPYVWMFLQSYEKMRNYLYHNATIETLIQFEYSAFEEATVPVCTFTIKNCHTSERGSFIRLTDFRGGMEIQCDKTLEAINNRDCGFYFEQSSDDFSKIPGIPVAYWLSDKMIHHFAYDKKLIDISAPKAGLSTCDNDRFLRFWFEIDIHKIDFQFQNVDELNKSTKKWFPMTKGGKYRKWYGNNEYVLNFENAGAELKYWITHNPKDPSTKSYSRYIRNYDKYGLSGFSFNDISSESVTFRFQPYGFIPNSRGPFIYSSDYSILAFLNSKITKELLKLIAPTLTFNVGDIAKLPIVRTNNTNIDEIVLRNISIAKKDWDAFETSWDFVRHPLIRSESYLIADAYKEWEAECEDRYNELKENEEELNRIFIDVYGLNAEITPEIEDKDITVRKAELTRDIKSLISYAVGCMFGRYSLDSDGLIFAGGTADDPKYNRFMIDKDNIIPICDDEYFEDDIVSRFVDFIRTVYGEKNLENNIRFIANALNGKGQPREVIRNYFLNGFYTDHLKTYQKRPIYWLFDSGKKGGFKCLVYLHRYQPDLIARIRTDYVHEQQSRYRTAISDLKGRISSASTSERVNLTKRLKKLTDQEEEIHVYEEKIHHLADQMIKIDLDDGVKKNYDLFKDVLVKIY